MPNKVERRKFLTGAGAAATYLALTSTVGCELLDRSPKVRSVADGSSSRSEDLLAFRSRPDLRPPAIDVALDEEDMSASLVHEYTHFHKMYAHAAGNVRVLSNGNVLIGWGRGPLGVQQGWRVALQRQLPAGLLAHRPFLPGLPLALERAPGRPTCRCGDARLQR